MMIHRSVFIMGLLWAGELRLLVAEGWVSKTCEDRCCRSFFGVNKRISAQHFVCCLQMVIFAW